MRTGGALRSLARPCLALRLPKRPSPYPRRGTQSCTVFVSTPPPSSPNPFSLSGKGLVLCSVPIGWSVAAPPHTHTSPSVWQLSCCRLSPGVPSCVPWAARVGDGRDARAVPALGQRRPHCEWLFPPAGRCCALPPAYGLVVAVLVAVLVAVILALAIALAVQSAGRREGHLAPVLGCPDNWVGYRDVCYYLSTEEGSWVWSQERCSSHGASLAVLQREWEMEFLSRLKGKDDFWLGLRRQGERLEWVDGSSFTQTILVRGQGACLYLNDNALVSTSCSQQRPYMCSKHYAQR
ncbi:early activation antigen CD69-like [Grus americana]|uniref:early activation antigen CD69-like n=1 Tax=Grus americana TaxID=9117 RepID=UPI002407A1DD|nr:early activation antigen CD69-like [Grus americana]